MSLKGGSVMRVTEFGPGFATPMHRTLSIDYAVVLSGDLEMDLDSGAVVQLQPGDVVVQRGGRVAKSQYKYAVSDHGQHDRSQAGVEAGRR